MTKPPLTRRQQQALIRRVEQAIARGWPPIRIMTELNVTYEQYRAVKQCLDELAAVDDEVEFL
jgi:hypothetical protein